MTKESVRRGKVHDAWHTFAAFRSCARTIAGNSAENSCWLHFPRKQRAPNCSRADRLWRAALHFLGLCVKEKLLPLGKVFRSLCCLLYGRPAFIFIVRFSACEIPAAHTTRQQQIARIMCSSCGMN